MNKYLIKAVAVTAELTNTELSEAAAKVMCQDLSIYPLDQVLGSLMRCRKELKGKMTTADVIERLEDGRPGAEEAWAMIPHDESQSVVWCREMSIAYSTANSLIQVNERISARMAFIQSYKKLVSEARDIGLEVSWYPSFGTDKSGRESALIEAVDKNRMTKERARELVPGISFPGEQVEKLEHQSNYMKKLASKVLHRK